MATKKKQDTRGPQFRGVESYSSIEVGALVIQSMFKGLRLPSSDWMQFWLYMALPSSTPSSTPSARRAARSI